MKLSFWLVLFGVVATLLATFAIANDHPVAVSFWPLPFVVPTRLYSVILVTSLIGFAAGFIMAWLAGWGLRREIRRLERDLAAEKQLRAKPSPTPS